MSEIVRPLLTTVDPTEAFHALRAGAITVEWVGVDAPTQGIRAKVPDGTEAAATTLLDGYAWTATRGEWHTPRPQIVQDAITTLKAFYTANPATVTAAQSATLHRAEVVILRFLFSDLED
jgi:hypothetical protein